jgi:hypothetical protein
LLDEIETRIGTETYSFGECKNILAACAEGEAFSLIPQCADCVFVGNIKDSRYDNLIYCSSWTRRRTSCPPRMIIKQFFLPGLRVSGRKRTQALSCTGRSDCRGPVFSS